MKTLQYEDTPRFGPDRLTIEEVIHMPKAQFNQWLEHLTGKEKPELIGEMFVYMLIRIFPQGSSICMRLQRS